MNFSGGFQEPNGRKHFQSSSDFPRNGSQSQAVVNRYASLGNTDIRSPYSNPSPSGAFSKANANLSQSLNHNSYSDPRSFDGITKYTNKPTLGNNSNSGSLNTRYQVPDANASMMENIRANCKPSRDAQKDKLVSVLSSDANVAILPGYGNSGRNNRMTRRSLGTLSSAPQLGPIAHEPLIPVERPPSAVTRAQAAIGLTKAHVRDAQNMLSAKSHNGVSSRSKKPNPWTNPFGDQDPLLAKRSKQATYRNDLLKQIEQSRNRKEAEKREEQHGVQGHPLGSGFNIRLPYSSHNNEIKINSFAPYQPAQMESRNHSQRQVQHSIPRNEIIGKAVPPKFARREFDPKETSSNQPQHSSRAMQSPHQPLGFPPFPNPAQMQNNFYPPAPPFYPYSFPPNMPYPPQPFPSFPPYHMPVPISPPPPLFQQPDNFNHNQNAQEDFRKIDRRMLNLNQENNFQLKKDRGPDQSNIRKEIFSSSDSRRKETYSHDFTNLEEADVEMDESKFRHHVWQTSDQLPDTDLKTAAYKTELRKQIRMNQRKREETMLKEREEDEKLDKKIEEYQRQMDAQLKEEREQATLLLKEKRTNGSVGIKVSHDQIVVGKTSCNSILDESFREEKETESHRPALVHQKRRPVTLKEKRMQTNRKQPSDTSSALSLLTNESTIFEEADSSPSTMSEKSSMASLGSTVIDTQASEMSLQVTAPASKMTINGKASNFSFQSTLSNFGNSETSILSIATVSENTATAMSEKSNISSNQSTAFISKGSEASINLTGIDESVSGNNTSVCTTGTNSTMYIFKNSNTSLDSASEVNFSAEDTSNSLINAVSGESFDHDSPTKCLDFSPENAIPVEAGSCQYNSISGSTLVDNNQTLQTSLKTLSSSQLEIPYENKIQKITRPPTPFHPVSRRVSQHRFRKVSSLEIGGGDKNMHPNMDVMNKASQSYNESANFTCSSQHEPNLLVFKCSSNNIEPLDMKSNSTCLLQIQKYLELEAQRVESLLLKYRNQRGPTIQKKKIHHGIRKQEQRRMKLFNRIIREISSV